MVKANILICLSLFPIICISHGFIQKPKFHFLLTKTEQYHDSIRTNILKHFSIKESQYNEHKKNIFKLFAKMDKKIRHGFSSLSSIRKLEFSLTNMIIAANLITYFFTKGVPGFQWLGPLFNGNMKLYRKLMKIDYLVARGDLYRLLTGHIISCTLF